MSCKHYLGDNECQEAYEGTEFEDGVVECNGSGDNDCSFYEDIIGSLTDFEEDIICSRESGCRKTNVPRRITKHSPDGFEWGYGGSGPADFALNILSIFVGQKIAERYYQDFKWQFVALLPYEGGTIRRADILSWLKKEMAKDADKN